jgi:hypothetical protein
LLRWQAQVPQPLNQQRPKTVVWLSQASDARSTVIAESYVAPLQVASTTQFTGNQRTAFYDQLVSAVDPAFGQIDR